MKQREPSQHELIAYLEQEVTPSEGAVIEGQLAESVSARRRLEELRGIRDALVTPMPEVARIDLVPAIRRAVAEPQRRRGAPGWLTRLRLWLSLSVATTAVVLLGLSLARVGDRPGSAAATSTGADEFRARASEPSRGEAERWVGLKVYRVDDRGEPERLGHRLKAEDGLLFAYTNVGPRPLPWLMAFAVGSTGTVYWYYPEFQEAASDPTSVRIQEAQADVELPDLIRQRLATGRLFIYGLFTRNAVRVSEVEAAVASQKEPGARLPFADSAQVILAAEVVP